MSKSYKSNALHELDYATEKAKEIIMAIPENELIGLGIYITRATEKSITGKVKKFTFGDIDSMLLGIMSLLDTALELVPDDLKIHVIEDIKSQIKKKHEKPCRNTKLN